MPSRVTPEAIADYYAGMPVKDVLEKYDISRTQFYRQLNKTATDLRGPVDRFAPETVKAMVADYDGGMSIDDLMKKYGSCRTTISKYISDAGCHIRGPAEHARHYDDAQIDRCIANYLNGLPAAKAGEWCGASEPTIFRWMKDRSIDRRHQPDYGGSKSFFKTLDSERALYWFGFLCADGTLTKKRYIRILLSEKDKAHLELFKEHIEYAKPVSTFKRVGGWKGREPKEYSYALLTIGARAMVDDLTRHGMRAFKSGDYSPLDAIDDRLYHHFMRGFIDGDGSIGRWNKKWWRLSACGPHRKLLEYLFSRCPVVTRSNAIIQTNKPYNSIWRVAYNGNRLVPRICEWLYRDATVFLPRKKERADKAIILGRSRGYL